MVQTKRVHELERIQRLHKLYGYLPVPARSEGRKRKELIVPYFIFLR